MRVPLVLVGLVLLAPGAVALLTPWVPILGPREVPVDRHVGLVVEAGPDHARAMALGIVGQIRSYDGGASVRLDLRGLSGGQVLVDGLLQVRQEDTEVASYRVQVAPEAAPPPDLAQAKLRLWSGSTPPVADGSPGVCAVLDLAAPPGTESRGACEAPVVAVQLVLALRDDAQGRGVLAFRPSGLVPVGR